MGTDIESIQQTYQSLARGNFAMLDNLKLGYGGTKAELQRLIHDASTYTDVQDELNLSVEDGNMSFGNIVKAISVVQKKLDITGTTAKEAATTFSGSFNSMKAAWEDLLGNIAIGADIGPSLNALATTASTFLFDNFIPMIGNVMKGLPEAISGFIAEAAPKIKEGLSKLFDTAGIKIDWAPIEKAFRNIESALRPVATAIKGMFSQISDLVSSTASQLGPVISTIVDAIGKLDFSGVASFLDKIVPAIQGFVNNALALMAPAITDAVSAFTELWNAIQPVLDILGQALGPVLQAIGTIVGGYFIYQFKLTATVFKLLAGVIEFLTPAIQFLGSVLEVVGNVISVVLTPVFQGLQAVFTAISDGVSGLINWFTSLFNSIMSNQTVVESMSLTFQGFEMVVNAVGAVLGWVGGVIGGVIGWIGNLISNIMQTEIVQQALQLTMQGAWAMIQSVVSIASAVISGAVAVIQGVFTAVGSVAQVVQGIISGAWNAVSGVIRTVQGVISSAMSVAGGAFSAFAGVVASVGGSVRGVVNSIISALRGLGNINLAGAGKAIMDGFLGGLKSTWEAGKGFISGIAGWVKAHKGPISYDKVLLVPAGRAIMGGFNSALISGFEAVKSNVLTMAPTIADSLNSAMDMATMGEFGNGKIELALTDSALSIDKVNNQEEKIYELLEQIGRRPIVVSNELDGNEFARLIATPLTEEQARRESIENAIYGRGWS